MKKILLIALPVLLLAAICAVSLGRRNAAAQSNWTSVVLIRGSRVSFIANWASIESYRLKDGAGFAPDGQTFHASYDKLTDNLITVPQSDIDAVLATGVATSILPPTDCRVGLHWRSQTDGIWWEINAAGMVNQQGCRCSDRSSHKSLTRNEMESGETRPIDDCVRSTWYDPQKKNLIDRFNYASEGEVHILRSGEVWIGVGSEDPQAPYGILAAKNTSGDVYFWVVRI